VTKKEKKVLKEGLSDIAIWLKGAVVQTDKKYKAGCLKLARKRVETLQEVFKTNYPA